jgi:hypothetical protein
MRHRVTADLRGRQLTATTVIVVNIGIFRDQSGASML